MATKPHQLIIPSIEYVNRLDHKKIKPIKSVAEVLKWEEKLREKFFGNQETVGEKRKIKAGANDQSQEIWFRGTGKDFPLAPGIYRREITDLAKNEAVDWSFGEDPPRGTSPLEWKRLNIEREMMLTFERESGPLLEYKFEQQLYFLARHYGMPSRLLDWSISPLIALFMCVFPEPRRPSRGKSTPQKQQDYDGIIYAMDPEGLDPPGYICHQHDPLVEEAIEVVTMWNDDGYEEDGNPAILPIRPHTLAGRIDRQLSRFTLHCHGAKPQENPTLQSRRVPKECKEQIRSQLERIGVNEFSVYYTLDRLTSAIIGRFSPPG
jgi:hypothetical protein